MGTKIARLSLALLAVSIHTISHADIVTVEFDASVTSKYDYSLGQYVAFAPLAHQYASVSFDNTLTYTSRNTAPGSPLNQYVFQDFGSAATLAVSSPFSYLQGENPYPQGVTYTMGGRILSNEIRTNRSRLL